MSTAVLEVNGLRVSYGHTRRTVVTVLDDVAFQLRAGEFVVIVGRSGCGKSTLLNTVAGLHRLDRGEVRFQGGPIDGPSRLRTLIPQDQALLPWRTLLSNVSLPLRLAGTAAPEARRLAAEQLGAVGLAEHADRYPWQISVGMRQRVALARALAVDPVLLLLDEPFNALDWEARAAMHDQLRSARERRPGLAILMVTHDLDEAAGLADRVVVLTGRPARVAADLAVDETCRRDRRRGPLQDELLRMMNGTAPAGPPPRTPADQSVS